MLRTKFLNYHKTYPTLNWQAKIQNSKQILKTVQALKLKENLVSVPKTFENTNNQTSSTKNKLLNIHDYKAIAGNRAQRVIASSHWRTNYNLKVNNLDPFRDISEYKDYFEANSAQVIGLCSTHMNIILKYKDEQLRNEIYDNRYQFQLDDRELNFTSINGLVRKVFDEKQFKPVRTKMTIYDLDDEIIDTILDQSRTHPILQIANIQENREKGMIWMNFESYFQMNIAMRRWLRIKDEILEPRPMLRDFTVDNCGMIYDLPKQITSEDIYKFKPLSDCLVRFDHETRFVWIGFQNKKQMDEMTNTKFTI